MVTLSGCEVSQYDDYVSECSVSDGTTRIKVYVSQDTDRVTDTMIPDVFVEACKLLDDTYELDTSTE